MKFAFQLSSFKEIVPRFMKSSKKCARKISEKYYAKNDLKCNIIQKILHMYRVIVVGEKIVKEANLRNSFAYVYAHLLRQHCFRWQSVLKEK